jgi:hypothetical protein
LVSIKRKGFKANSKRRNPEGLRLCRGGYAANSKAAISTAADLRATLAAGAMGAS